MNFFLSWIKLDITTCFTINFGYEHVVLFPSPTGKSDPYCEVSMGSQEHKTKVISNTLNPKWNASMQFTIRDVDMDALCITVFDRDLFSPNGRQFTY